MKSTEKLFLNHEIYFDEYITGNRFIDICDMSKVKFCKTDFILEAQQYQNDILITHNSDYPITVDLYDIVHKNIKKWFAQNKNVDSNKIVSVPIGLENIVLRVTPQSRLGLHSSRVKNALQKAKYIEKVARKKSTHDKLIYLNINPKTWPQERQYIIDIFKQKDWVTYQKNVTWQQYYDSIATHKFVFSPRGNGIDCHRTWEALYLRTIPIVKTSICMDDFQDLPILFINNWDEINYNLLLSKYEKISNKKYDLSKMKISYWKDRITEALNE